MSFEVLCRSRRGMVILVIVLFVRLIFGGVWPACCSSAVAIPKSSASSAAIPSGPMATVRSSLCPLGLWWPSGLSATVMLRYLGSRTCLLRLASDMGHLRLGLCYMFSAFVGQYKRYAMWVGLMMPETVSPLPTFHPPQKAC